ncbi:MAG: histone family protein DNA-binding protein [Bacteroidetes bacterium]|nr:histone family protein DNA-binding protein [Bacteroidota bacterium]
MSNDKISSLELISALAEQTGTTKKVATAFMRQFSETVEEALLRDGIVKIKGFGTFKITWNESRSSINVNTGERYEIAGHNKITFTPDDEVSEIVNRPFAHLEPVNLDGSSVEKTTELPEEDPHMKRFSEQASEIVNLIADMQAFKPKKKAKPTVQEESPKIGTASEQITEPIATPEPIEEEQSEIEAEQPQEEVLIEETKTENVNPEPEPQQVVAESEKPEAEPTPEAPVPTDALAVEEAAPATKSAESLLIERMEEQPARRSLKWLYISASIVILLAGAGAACYFCFPELFSHTAEPKQVVVQAVAKPTPPAPVAQKKDTVVKPETPAVQKAAPEKPKDVFSESRVYKEFIATETATEGTWLTILSLKYYGHKLFWVYIYEANKNKLRDPGVLPPGTKIRIPKLDPRLIDKHDGRCFRLASKLQTLYTTNQ